MERFVGSIHFFASRLKYSRFVRVSLVKDETVESLVRNLAEHLQSWGGVPLLCVFDRPKTVALKWRRNGEVTEWNPVFAYAMLEMGVGVELCWPQQPQQKGAVENLVGFVKSSFFKARRFQAVKDDWSGRLNHQNPSQDDPNIDKVHCFFDPEFSRCANLSHKWHVFCVRGDLVLTYFS